MLRVVLLVVTMTTAPALSSCPVDGTSLLQIASDVATGRQHQSKHSLQPTGSHGRSEGYALLMDAGSSGSRIGIYKIKDGEISEVPGTADLKTEPGLSSFADDPSKANPGLKRIIDAAAAKIPAAHRPKTKLWVKATAGMRTLTEAQISAVFNSVKTFLKDSTNSPFDFQFAQVISGEEEALFTYLATNHMKGLPAGDFNSVGILEIGGASNQIAFVPSTDDIKYGEFSLYVDGQLKSVYATSYMFGINLAMERHYKALAEKNTGGGDTLSDPCGLTVLDEEIEVFGLKYKIKGTGENSKCEAAVKKLLHEDYECNLKPCPMMGRHVSPITAQQKFLGVANFFHAVNNLNLIPDPTKAETVVTPNELKTGLANYCKADNKPDTSSGGWKYMKNACFLGHLVSEMIDRLGFQGDSKQIAFSKAYDWKLGSMLYDLEYMPAKRPC